MKTHLFAFLIAPIASALSASTAPVEVRRADSSLRIERAGREVVTYNLRPLADSALSVKSGAFFHPLKTPAGVVVTDFAPSDHRHHRGIFFGWIEVRGEKAADFLGWGKHAPKEDRQIVNRAATIVPNGFRATNDWTAESVVLAAEILEASVGNREDVHVLDLVFRITPKSDLKIAQSNFGGFCLRGRAEGEVEIHAPTGPVTLPNPSPAKLESAWPHAAWYALALTPTNGTKAGVAVISHPQNPATRWHNSRKLALLNPSVVAEAPLMLPAGKQIVLRYRVVAFDGVVPRAKLDQLARELSAR